jgi:5-formyltetrahydrofolate cyclo-ligase
MACSQYANVSKGALRHLFAQARRNRQRHPDEETALGQRIADILVCRLPRCVAFYWPLAGEFDARAVLTDWLQAQPGRCAALPVVTAIDQPLCFYRWTPATLMTTGHFRLPVPADAVEVCPDLLLVPCVGFDLARYRLGYGGGYYDRTLSRLHPRPFTVGIAYECTRIYALPHEVHDIPLDLILSERAQY